nr:MAG TPA: hypothetical protein [Caudoviricetes sp.]
MSLGSLKWRGWVSLLKFIRVYKTKQPRLFNPRLFNNLIIQF